MFRAIYAAMRGLAARGAVLGVADGTAAQRVDIETHDGVLRQAVEVLQPYGFASSPPAGAVVIVLALGADPGDLVALPASAPGESRFGGLGTGEVAIYDGAGNRVHIRAGGIVEILAATKVRVVAPEIEVVGNVVITGDLTVSGQVSDGAGSMQEMRDRYNGHRHAGGPTPSPEMD